MYYFIILIHFILFVELIFGENSIILKSITTKKISTFVTLVDESYVTPYYINKDEHQITSNNNNNNSSNLYHIFNGVNLSFEQVKLFLIGFILIFIILIIIVLVIIKKVTNCCIFKLCFRQLCPKKSQNNISKTDSTMSGECGCVMRFRKNKNNKTLIKQSLIDDVDNGDAISKSLIIQNIFLNSNQKYPKLKRLISVSLNELNEVDTNYFDRKNYNNKNIKTVKSALVLISIKVSQIIQFNLIKLFIINLFIYLFSQMINQRMTNLIQ